MARRRSAKEKSNGMFELLICGAGFKWADTGRVAKGARKMHVSQPLKLVLDPEELAKNPEGYINEVIRKGVDEVMETEYKELLKNPNYKFGFQKVEEVKSARDPFVRVYYYVARRV